MLLPHEFSVGYIGNATGLTLVLPIDDYDRVWLVTSAPGKPTAIAIDEKENFGSFMCENNTSWKGLLIPNIAVELDERAKFDAVGWSVPLGAVVRRDDSLFISAKVDRAGPNALVPILTGLPASQANMAAGFKKWQISVGEGTSKRTLLTFDGERRNELED